MSEVGRVQETVLDQLEGQHALIRTQQSLIDGLVHRVGDLEEALAICIGVETPHYKKSMEPRAAEVPYGR
jgi:hypothetical protein